MKESVVWERLVGLPHAEDAPLSADELAFRRSRYKDLTDEEWRLLLQQQYGRQYAMDKLPEMAQTQGWLFPPKLNLEQCSSQATACYKRDLIQPLHLAEMTDLTGGFGIDFYYMSQAARHANYVERNSELCDIVSHNMHLTTRSIEILNTDSEAYIQQTKPTVSHPHLVFLDPARRSKTGGKVFRIEDCEPNVMNLLPRLREKADYVMLKLSPMLDVTAAMKALGGKWQTHIVAVGGEVKEVLLLQEVTPKDKEGEMPIICTDLRTEMRFEFTREEEQAAEIPTNVGIGRYIYEPHPAILKAGAFRTVAKRWKIQPPAADSHLYVSEQWQEDFPGRIFEIEQRACSMRDLQGIKANVICRNYGMTAEELKRKLRIKDGGDMYIIGTKVTDGSRRKPTLFLAKRKMKTTPTEKVPDITRAREN